VPIFTIEAHNKEDIETSLERVRNLIDTGLPPTASA
jgi:hypothetical protein